MSLLDRAFVITWQAFGHYLTDDGVIALCAEWRKLAGRSIVSEAQRLVLKVQATREVACTKMSYSIGRPLRCRPL